MRAAVCVFVVATACVGCGAPSFEGWSTARAHVPGAEDPPERERLAIRPLVVLAAGASAPFAVMGDDGRLSGPGCDVIVGADGVVRDAASATVRLRVEEDGRVLDGSGEERFRIDGARLVRAGGAAVTIEPGERIAEIRFEGSPALAMRVEGANEQTMQRTALVVVAALARCGA